MSPAGAEKLVERSVREGHHIANHLPHMPIAAQDTGAVARLLVDAILDRLQRGQGQQCAYEANLVSELAGRDIRGSAAAFATAAEAAWSRQHEAGYPASMLEPDARQGPHGSPGHVCWQPLAATQTARRAESIPG